MPHQFTPPTKLSPPEIQYFVFSYNQHFEEFYQADSIKNFIKQDFYQELQEYVFIFLELLIKILLKFVTTISRELMLS